MRYFTKRRHSTWSMPSCSIGKFFNMKYPIYDKQGTVSENDIDADGGITKITVPSISTYCESDI